MEENFLFLEKGTIVLGVSRALFDQKFTEKNSHLFARSVQQIIHLLRSKFNDNVHTTRNIFIFIVIYLYLYIIYYIFIVIYL